jgi:hypothetical protein
MILFGAGSSIPFDIPGMADFTQRFLNECEYNLDLINAIKGALSNSEETIGVSLPFDLEALLSVLNDLAEIKPQKPISVATASLLLKEKLTAKTARKKYKTDAAKAFSTLNAFIFKTCMKPIVEGKKKG